MELKPLKKGEAAVTVTYHISEELVNKKINFIRATDGIPAVYIDDQGTPADDCTITVAHKETADVIRGCSDFNPNVKITVE